MLSSWRIVLKRALSDRMMLVAAMVTTILAITVLAAGPIYSESVTLASLHRILGDGSSGASIEVEAVESPGSFDDLDRVVRQVVETGLVTETQVLAQVTGASYALEREDESGLFALASLQYLEDVAEHATLIEGSWPESGEPEAVLTELSADLLEVQVGDEVTLVSRRDGSTSQVRVVGVILVDNPTDLYWHGDDLIRAGAVESGTFRTFGPFLMGREVILDTFTHTQAEMAWRVLPSHDQLDVASIPQQLSAVRALESRLNTAVDRDVFTVQTSLGDILASAEQSVVATRSSVLMLSVQLAILAGYALMHTAGLLVDNRVVETGLLRSRGAGNGQILGVAAMEGVILTLPAIVIAPPLAAALLRILGSVGPLAGIGLSFEPRISASAYMLSAVAALFCILALGIPAYRSSRTFNDSLVARSRQESRSMAQRAGWDVALLAFATVGFWQLATHGVQLSSTLRDQWGVDPLLVAVPALGMLAGAILALRFVPLVARVLERGVKRGKSTVSALSAWQVARRPQRYSRASLLLIIAISVGFFVVAYSETWTQSQRDQAAFVSGADVRVVPIATVGSLGDAHLGSGHEAIDGVEVSTPVALASGQLVRNGPVTRYFAVDAAEFGQVMALRVEQLGSQFDERMAQLVSLRPQVESIPLEGLPTSLGAKVEVEGSCDGECLAPELSAILVDANGLFHRFELGQADSTPGGLELTTSLIAEPADRDQILPKYPLALLAIEFLVVMPGDSATEQLATLNLEMFTIDQESVRRSVEFSPDLVTSWEAPALIHGTSVTPAIAVSGGPGSLTISLNTGLAQNRPTGADLHFGIRPAGSERVSEVPLVVTEGLLARTGVAPDARVELGRFDTVSGLGRLVGSVPMFPTIDAGVQEAVLLDLPTLHAASYRPGWAIERAGEYWLGLGDHDIDTVVGALQSIPFNSAQVVTLASQTDNLTGDPMALSTIAALSLGFIAALVFAIIGFTVNIIVLARERQTEFTLLRALGLSARQLRSWLGLEQIGVIVAGLALGTLIGVLLSVIVLPLISVTQAGNVPVPAPEVIIPVQTIVILNLVIVLVLGLVVAWLAGSARRRDIAAQLRMGEQ